MDVLIFWLVNHAPSAIEDIQITYPVRDHSFLPADRVFGRLEKELSKFPVITSKEEYISSLNLEMSVFLEKIGSCMI